YRHTKHSFTLGYDFNQGFRGNEGFSDRKTYLANDTLYRVGNSDRWFHNYRNSIRGGYDWDISNKTTFGVTGMMQIGSNKRNSESNQYLTSTSRPDTTFRISKTNERGNQNNYDVNTTLIHKFNTEGHELQFMATVSGNQDDENIRNYLDNFNQNIHEWWDTIKTDENYQTMQIDYSRPLGLVKIETGARSRFRQIDFRNQTFNNPYIPSNQGINHFLYDDQIHAFYAIGKSKIENWEFQLGLRTEYYRIITEQKSNNEKNTKEDINFFPTFHISNSVGENKIMLSYSRRVTRPHIRFLNPYEEWDNDNVRKGNPLLDPEFSHSLELNYLRYFGQSTASGTVFYRQTDNSISSIQKLYDNTGIIMMTFDNIRKQASLGVEISLRHSFTQWFQFDGNYSFFYSSISGEALGETVNNDSYNHSVRANLNFRVSRNTSVSGFVMYNSPSVTAQGKRGAFYNNGLSVRQQVLDRKGTITLSVRNPIGKFRWEFETSGNDFYNYTYREPYMPVVTLGFSYKINEGIRKKRTNGERSEDFSPDMEL
ncbi:MAG TPA: outer membrane beta-barrel family protein, partial [Salinivirgaceae bacterium]|nr:outer membrane beta-barrel family protein [Salinivirgaceae bacterium]